MPADRNSRPFQSFNQSLPYQRTTNFNTAQQSRGSYSGTSSSFFHPAQDLTQEAPILHAPGHFPYQRFSQTGPITFPTSQASTSISSYPPSLNGRSQASGLNVVEVDCDDLPPPPALNRRSPALGLNFIEVDCEDRSSLKTTELAFKVHVEVFIPDEPDEDAHSSRSRSKRSTKASGPTVPTYTPLKKDWEIRVSVHDDADLELFRSLIFSQCDLLEANISEALTAALSENDLKVTGWIHAHKSFLKNKQFEIMTDTAFNDFISACLDDPMQSMHLDFVQTNPKTKRAKENNAEKVARNLARLKQNRAQGAHHRQSTPNNDDDDDEARLLKVIQDLTTRFTKSEANGESSIRVINPENKEELIKLNTNMIKIWAQDIVNGVPGVSNVKPPLRRGWKWISISEFKKQEAEILQARISRLPVPANTSTAAAVPEAFPCRKKAMPIFMSEGQRVFPDKTEFIKAAQVFESESNCSFFLDFTLNDLRWDWVRSKMNSL